MADFYDLCVGYDDLTEQARWDVVAMAMQLGYSGIAFNHFVKGMLSDLDRCRICPVNIKPLEDSGAVIAETAKFHRKLLGVTNGSGFRQYSRVTLVLDDSSVSAVINSSHALRSYDLVAVQPTTLKAFGQACQQLEVDIISVNFDQRLSFRMKLPMVKAAIERGIFFEIVYNGALSDLKARMEMFGNSQMLQGWTHGKNLIVSSGASRCWELRGPNDVANLSTLFGLTPENAKAAVSKNCRSAILHGVSRRKFYKGAICVERCQPDGSLGSDKLLFDIPKKWDPLASVLTETVSTTSGPGVSSKVNTRDNAVTAGAPLEPSPGNSQGLAVEDLRLGQVTDAVAKAEAGADVDMICNPFVTADEPVELLGAFQSSNQTLKATPLDITPLDIEASANAVGLSFVTPVKGKFFDRNYTPQSYRTRNLMSSHPATKPGKRKESASGRLTGDQNRKKQKMGKRNGKKAKRKP